MSLAFQIPFLTGAQIRGSACDLADDSQLRGTTNTRGPENIVPFNDRLHHMAVLSHCTSHFLW